MKISILEFTPCADLIYQMRRDPEEGYVAADSNTLTFRPGARLRPRMMTTYAGGKATNVARVIERLLTAEDNVEVELIVFRPDSAEGRYIHELQKRDLKRVQLLPVIVEATARFCVDIADKAGDAPAPVEFNLSPRCLWRNSALERTLECASTITADLLLLAGNPPMMEETGQMASDLAVKVIEELRPRIGIISLDTEKRALADCLGSRRQPDVIKINDNEYSSVEQELWKDFSGTLIVTDAAGCRVWENGASMSPERTSAPEVPDVYSTVGAGDAMHAGFTISRWVRKLDCLSAARFGQAAAAAAVSSPQGTRGVTREDVEKIFDRATAH
jgi:fructose-1-phosphate kinase PfkB-like protein